ncbi:Hydrolase-4 domain-containing protein [Mycena chlorophos]|uniref:Hydrolase-4 domain-containing protein n=1 Tax=Mycena chlorophos TaxID=658473 RepID=A0A8H6SDA8_MYCCL|nr:Hydrolase-4 domain-containing protein [Mycena chlorophos]
MSTWQFISELVRHGQKFLVYPSAFLDHPREISKPSDIGLEYTDIQLHTSDGVRLDCYFIRQAAQSAARLKQREEYDFPPDRTSTLVPPTTYKDPARANIIMFHGNGMNYGDLIFAAKHLVMLRCNILLLSYRGYGTSGGTPSESGIRLDAQAALEYLRTNTDLAPLPIILYGTSIGAAVAIDLASRNPTRIHALIIENTFLSLPRVVRAWPYIGVFSFLCMQRWNSAAKIPLIPARTPMLFLSGRQDEVVPRRHMEELWGIAQKRKPKKPEGESESKPALDRFESFAEGTHADTFLQPRYWDKVDNWLRAVVDSEESDMPA